MLERFDVPTSSSAKEIGIRINNNMKDLISWLKLDKNISCINIMGNVQTCIYKMCIMYYHVLLVMLWISVECHVERWRVMILKGSQLLISCGCYYGVYTKVLLKNQNVQIRTAVFIMECILQLILILSCH